MGIKLLIFPLYLRQLFLVENEKELSIIIVLFLDIIACLSLGRGRLISRISPIPAAGPLVIIITRSAR